MKAINSKWRYSHENEQYLEAGRILNSKEAYNFFASSEWSQENCWLLAKSHALSFKSYHFYLALTGTIFLDPLSQVDNSLYLN